MVQRRPRFLVAVVTVRTRWHRAETDRSTASSTSCPPPSAGPVSAFMVRWVSRRCWHVQGAAPRAREAGLVALRRAEMPSRAIWSRRPPCGPSCAGRRPRRRECPPTSRRTARNPSRRRSLPLCSQTMPVPVAQESAVVADHQKRAAVPAQHLLQPFDSLNVKVICRLVEEQDVGLGIERAGKRYAARLAAGQPVRQTVRVEPEPLKELLGLVDRHRPAEPVGVMAGDDDASQRHAGRDHRRLRKIGDAGARGHPVASLIHVGAAGHQLHQARLAGAVAPDEGQPVAGMKRQVGAAKKPAVAEIDPGRGDGQKRCRHLTPPPSPCRGPAPSRHRRR